MHYDMEDLLEQANEIQESMGRSYAVPDEIDEADLEAGTFHLFLSSGCIEKYLLELDALALEEEEESTSYLADLNKVPDFVDEPPVELGEASTLPQNSELDLKLFLVSHTSSRQDDLVRAQILYLYYYNRTTIQSTVSHV